MKNTTPFSSQVMHWHDGMVLGYTPMDLTHEAFTRAVAHLQTCEDAELPDALAQLSLHLQEHFSQEELWMQETQFPAWECHRDEHAAVMASVSQVQTRLAQGDSALARRLAQELMQWFPGHADYMDAALAHWMCRQRLGGKPVVLRRHIPRAD